MLTLNILANTKRREALCSSCAHEVINKGHKGEKLTFCSYRGGLRELKFEVCECTVYFDSRVTPPKKVIGFIKPGEPVRPKVTRHQDRLAASCSQNRPRPDPPSEPVRRSPAGTSFGPAPIRKQFL